MHKIKVSIVIPVFNTEEFLIEAINSILQQTLQEIEIIAVNDGSTDNSLQLLMELSKKDSRLNVISLEQNAGLSISRNTGLKHASGEFIYFFDSDDILNTDCLELCYKKSVAENLDFLFFDGISFYHDGVMTSFSRSYERTQHLIDRVYTGKDILVELNKHNGYSSSVCLSFIRLEYLKTIDLEFYPGIWYEDLLFTIILYLSAQRVGFINHSFFQRRIRSNSIMNSSISQKSINYRLVVCNEIILQKQNFTNSESKKLLNLQVWNALKFLIKGLLRTRQIKLLLSNGYQILELLFKASRI